MDNPMYASGTKVIREQFTDPLTPDKYTVLESLRGAAMALRQLSGSQENSLAITKVEEAIMWLEKS